MDGQTTVIPLVDRFRGPKHPKARTRTGPTPGGYGVREQCPPYAAASTLGLLIPAPFSWGRCEQTSAPKGARTFLSPVESENGDRHHFYVIDDPSFQFVGNEYLVPDHVTQVIGTTPIPGLSFFLRPDQQSFVKVHLPYVWRTEEEVDLLFVDPLNRSRKDGLRVVAGLVETSWYANPVNLVVRLPPSDVHVEAGTPLAHAIPLKRDLARPDLATLDPRQQKSHLSFVEMRDWRTLHDEDRSAYRHIRQQIRRSRSGRELSQR